MPKMPKMPKVFTNIEDENDRIAAAEMLEAEIVSGEIIKLLEHKSAFICACTLESVINFTHYSMADVTAKNMFTMQILGALVNANEDDVEDRSTEGDK